MDAIESDRPLAGWGSTRGRGGAANGGLFIEQLMDTLGGACRLGKLAPDFRQRAKAAAAKTE